MKTKHFLLLVILFCFSITSFGQFEKFDLGKYVNPDYKRQQLNLSLNLNGSSGVNKSTVSENPFKNSSAAFNSSINGTYYSVYNSIKKQSNWQLSLAEHNWFDNQKQLYYIDTAYYKEKTKNNDISLNVQTYNRFYFSNHYFWELDFKGTVSNSYDKSTTNYYGRVTNSLALDREDKSNYSHLSGELGLRIGKGRIEYVEDARLAVYILEDLGKHNRLSRNPTDEEILEFAKVITQIKNKRFFDSRIRRIEEITKADSFLITSNLINKSDAAYFTTLNDNWVNAAGPVRGSGLRYSIGINPIGAWNPENVSSYYTNVSYSNTDFDYSYKNLGVSTDLQIDYNKPLSLKWQMNGGLNVKYSIYQLKTRNVDHINNSTTLSNEHYNELNANIFFNLNFYPNSRTSFTGSVWVNSRYAKNKLIEPVEVDNKGDYHYLVPNFSFSGTYYVSERLQLSGYYSINYMYGKTSAPYNYSHLQSLAPSSRAISQNFTMSLSYAFF